MPMTEAVDETRAATPDVSVVVPCFNEARNLPELVDRLTTTLQGEDVVAEIILVDDGSSDDTGTVIDHLAQESSSVVPIHHRTNRGIEAAWASGVRLARGTNVCFIDADLQNLPEDVARLLREIRFSRADVVQGYRLSVVRPPLSRLVLSKGLNWILNGAFGMHQRDNKSGFVIARREVVADILRHRFSYRYYQTFIAVAAAAKGYRLREIETLFDDRRIGSSFLSNLPVDVVLWSFLDIAKAVVEFRVLGRPDPTLAEFLRQHPPARQDAGLTGWRRWLFGLFRLTAPLHKWVIGRDAWGYYDELRRSQYLSPADMRELQERKLRRLIAHAFDHVGYYRARMDELGLRPADIQTLDDLSKLPLLGKEVVRQRAYRGLLSDNHDKRQVLRVTTSGTTGEPLVCYADKRQLEMRWAATQRSVEWTGYRFGERTARLWHQTINMTRTQVVKERIDAWFSRRFFVPVFAISDRSIAGIVARLRRKRPVLLDGYAEALHLLADYITTHGLRAPRVRAVISSAQTLPDHSRQLIRRAFGCEVFDKYGSREFSGIAYECEAHDGHHVVAENYVVEILRNGHAAQPGELGEVVITDLNNFAMPFIRYRIGDLAVAMDGHRLCPCGRGLPRIGRIEGRLQSIIVGARGEYVPGAFFAHVLKDYDHLIRQYQVVQERPGAIRLRIVKGLRFDPVAFETVLRTLRTHLGEGTEIEVEFPPHIELGSTGKRELTVSTVGFDPQAGFLEAPLHLPVRTGRRDRR
jgi:phenylacetate-CoA ligase